MNSISLKSMPTSEIIFSFLNLGLNKDLASQTLEKRLKGYGLSDDEIVNFIAREIVKIKTRGKITLVAAFPTVPTPFPINI